MQYDVSLLKLETYRDITYKIKTFYDTIKGIGGIGCEEGLLIWSIQEFRNGFFILLSHGQIIIFLKLIRISVISSGNLMLEIRNTIW